MSVHHRYVSKAQGGQKRASSPLELELQMVVSDHVGAGNRTSIFCKSSKYSEPLSCFFPAPKDRILQTEKFLLEVTYLQTL